jgi:hypothetical protein
MIARVATIGLIAVFLGSVLCALACPQSSKHETKHVCNMPDHSCCPASKDKEGARPSSCLDTHFMGVSKFEPAAPGMTVTVHAAEVFADESLRLVVFERISIAASSSPPVPDVLSMNHLLRI